MPRAGHDDDVDIRAVSCYMHKPCVPTSCELHEPYIYTSHIRHNMSPIEA